MPNKKVIIIGAGVGGLATACILGQAGYDVTVYEKGSQAGGRAGSFEAKGFRFDTGPSWYLMPDIFKQYFKMLGEDVDKLLKLKRLSPSYRVFFKDTLFGAFDIVGNVRKDGRTLESLEPGAQHKLQVYVEKSTYQYNLAMDKFLYRNYDSVLDFLTPQLLSEGLRLNIFSNMQNYVAKYFSSPSVQKIIEYPLMFLGASPHKAPAMYNIMSQLDFKQGVFYPQGGMYKLVEILVELAEARGVKIVCDTPVKSIVVEKGGAKGVKLTSGKTLQADIVISNNDIRDTEKSMLRPQHRSYSEKYWRKRVLAPSALLIYLGVKKKYPNLRHHNLVFSKDWDANFRSIFEGKTWPSDPSFYVSCPSKTDRTVAPKGHENLFVLVPLPAGTNHSEKELTQYADWIIDGMEKSLHLDGLTKNIVYRKLFGPNDFKEQFNSYEGTALGLAHTFRQTAVFRPSNKSKKVKNLYYVGANTTPGIGLPMCLVSAQLVYKRIISNTDSKPIKKIESLET
jgi:phytoene desaturase